MGGSMGVVIQPPETQNVFLCLSIVVGLLWVINAAWRCWAVVQLRRALGSRRLVAIRGVGRRVRVFRLLGRHYLQRALGRNHLQALVHTRQANPPKTMPCSLLLASDPIPSGGIKAILHPRDRGDDSSLSPPSTGGAALLSASSNAGPLVGVSVVLDCRVACTVELLWDVDLALLGKEMGLHPKLHLLPASTGADGICRGNAGRAGAGAHPAAADPRRGGVVGGGMSRVSALLGDMWGSVVSLVAGAPPESSSTSSSSASLQQQHRRGPGWRGRGSSGGGGGRGDDGGGGGYVDEDDDDNYDDDGEDEEMGRGQQQRGGEGGREGGGGGGGRRGGGGGEIAAGAGADGNSSSVILNAAPLRREGAAASTHVGGGGGGGGRSSWAAALGFRKAPAISEVVPVSGGVAWATGGGGEGEGADGGVGGSRSGQRWGRGGAGSGGGGGGIPGEEMGLCGKRTVPRALSAGGCRVFQTLPGESYFRSPPQGGAWARAAAAAAADAGADAAGGPGGGCRDGGAAVAADGEGVGACKRRRRNRRGGGQVWPRVEDSVRAGRCSLAIIIRPLGGPEVGDGWAGWRHRPTHDVTRQVLLVQLTERSAAAGGGGAPPPSQQAPSARCLRHLVAISKDGGGSPSNGGNSTETIYSFSEVFGAGDEVGGSARPLPDPASVVDSVQALVGGGSDSSIASGVSNQQQQQQQQSAVAAGAGALTGGGDGELQDAECVICLTEPKDTLLLPCRHLCVCTECFRHVDKCPVCRSAFDNYIVLSRPPLPPPPPSPQQPRPGPPLPASVVVGGAASNTAATLSIGSGVRGSGGGGGAGTELASSSLRRTATVVPIAGPPQQQPQNPMRAGSYSSSLATAAASMLPTVSLPGIVRGGGGGGSRRGSQGSDGGGSGTGGEPSVTSPAAGASNVTISSGLPARGTIFAVSRRRVAE
ncbi:unnamed protein product [Pylaiella littoralis]